jgi:hypothetical protein
MGRYEQRDSIIITLIKSNLIGFGLSIEQIEHISENCSKDLIDFLAEFDLAQHEEKTLCG